MVKYPKWFKLILAMRCEWMALTMYINADGKDNARDAKIDELRSSARYIRSETFDNYERGRSK